jgi:MerR family transcriptional regulator, light-induced transcriptional regulator
MARGDDDTSGRPPLRSTSDTIADLARRALERLAEGVGDVQVSAAFVESFCKLLMSGDKVGAERMLKAATQRREGYAKVADGLLSAAARRMGEMWQNDEASFPEVSIGVSLIFRLNHEHAQRNMAIRRDPALRQAVFATTPGQAHNLGLVLAAEAFREADWQVTLLLDAAMGQILDRVRGLRPEVVGLSVSTLDRRHQLEQLIGDLGAMPFGVRILLGGTAADDMVDALPHLREIRVVHDIESTLDELRS